MWAKLFFRRGIRADVDLKMTPLPDGSFAPNAPDRVCLGLAPSRIIDATA
jgi:hypothetical protein